MAPSNNILTIYTARVVLDSSLEWVVKVYSATVRRTPKRDSVTHSDNPGAFDYRTAFSPGSYPETEEDALKQLHAQLQAKHELMLHELKRLESRIRAVQKA